MTFINKYNKLLLGTSSFILFYIIFIWINYLVSNNFIRENFTSIIEKKDSENTNHTVDLPLTTTTSCKNFCGPTARCAITGQQCFTDIDCPGCQPYIPPVTLQKQYIVPGDDDAGKLTLGVTPQYSPLTNGYGTKERIVTDDLYSKPSQANFGINSWRSSYDEDTKLFDQRYRPSKSNLKFVPDYSKTYSLTGEFLIEGPLAANAYL
jgi:hypothetical protein